jgi:hypothetical protein
MKKIGFALLSLFLMFSHAAVFANESAPAEQQDSSGSTTSEAGGAEPDC